MRPQDDRPARAAGARAARVALAADPHLVEAVDAVPRPPGAARGAVVPVARAVRALPLVGEHAAAGAGRAGARVPRAREPGRRGYDSEARLSGTRQESTASRRFVIAEFLEPLVKRHLRTSSVVGAANVSSSCWS